MLAIIDIGTNSTLLLIARITGDGTVEVVEDIATVTKLGEGLSKNSTISDKASERTLTTLSEYKKLCVDHGVERIVTVGTAALRTAKNASDFCMIAKRELGLDIKIISGEEEATLTFSASAHDFGANIEVIDIGGGSTEIISNDGSESLNSASLPIGCVNLTEQFLKSEPVSKTEVEALRSTIRKKLKAAGSRFTVHGSRFVATAGTATTLMAMNLGLDKYSRDAVHGKTISIDWLQETIGQLQPKSIDERKSIAGLPADRADVILAGAIILDEVMQKLASEEVTISDAGVRRGILYEELHNKQS
jgi:exopolyphosphatase / guanosine-5'-triphosphate,3'-diphosphate pyrophosphatase